MTTTVNGLPKGRPTDCTPELQTQILDYLGRGMPVNLSCQAVGIDVSTLTHWRSRARDGDEPYLGFIAAVKKARAIGQRVVGDRILDASKKPQHWTAGAWWLERTDPENFGRRDRLQVDQVTKVVFHNEEIAKTDHEGVIEVEGRVVSEITEKGSE